MSAQRRSIGAQLLLWVLAGYRWVSQFLPSVCRFYPSCSAYAVEAISVHGALRGSALAVRRLLRCHPWQAGGLDPVPERRGRRDRSTEERAPC